MENMILVDIETGDFDVDSGIYEVAALVIENGKVVLSEHIAEVEDEDSIHLGMGSGYAQIAQDVIQKRNGSGPSFKNITIQLWLIMSHLTENFWSIMAG